MLKTHYKYLVIGAGSGGIASARRAAQFTEGVGIIEHKKPGGTCVNLGCVPKKILWNLGIMKKELSMFSESGVIKSDTEFADWNTLRAKKQEYIAKLNSIYLKNLDHDKIDYIKGLAEIVDKNTVKVGDAVYTADRLLLALGSKPKVPDIPGAKLAITSDDYFHLDRLPKSLLLVGSGYIGIETACTLLNYGVNVTLLMNKEFVLENQDHESGDFLLSSLEKRGNFKVIRKAQLVAIDQCQATGDKVAKLEDGRELRAESVMLAIGREPLTKNIGLEKVGIKLGPRNEVLVDGSFQTSIGNVYAIGDCIGRLQLTPVAIREGRILAENLFNPKKPNYRMDYEDVPTVVFADPPYASCGLSEEEAVRRFGKEDIEVYRSRFKNMYYALAPEHRKEESLFKLIAVKSLDKRIVGAHLVGKGADEMIQTVGIAIKMGATKKQFDAVVAVHPTAAEELVLMQPHFL